MVTQNDNSASKVENLDFIPCCYLETWSGDYGTHYEACNSEVDTGEIECSTTCPSYKPVPVYFCQKHKKQYVESCDECDGEYWEKLARREERNHRIEVWLEHHRLLIKASRFDQFQGWVLNYRPCIRQEWKSDLKGRAYYGIELTGLRRSFRIGIYIRRGSPAPPPPSEAVKP